MAVKGTESKNKLIQELLDYFKDRAFLYNDGKEIRVNCMEAGAPVQIKIAFTAAKEIVEVGADNALPGVEKATSTTQETGAGAVFGAFLAAPQPTEEEKHNVKELLAKLGL